MLSDAVIIELCFNRNEHAIEAVKHKYGRYCFTIAKRILNTDSLAEECVDDALMAFWQAVPPAKPVHLPAYLARLVRNRAVNMLEYLHAEKRLSNSYAPLDELCDIVTDEQESDTVEKIALSDSLNDFLSELEPKNRVMFVKRYFYAMPTRKISRDLGVSESNVKVSLMRTRKRLADFLKERGFDL